MSRNFISELTKIVPPPATPLDKDNGEAVLRDNEKKLKIKFPADFVEFGRVYGSGTFEVPKSSWEVWSPFRRTYPMIAQYFFDMWEDTWNGGREKLSPPGLFPEPGGLLPFCITNSAAWICWKTDGKSDEWPVVDMLQYQPNRFETFPFSTTEYFTKVLSQAQLLKRLEKRKWAPKDVRFVQKVLTDKHMDPDEDA